MGIIGRIRKELGGGSTLPSTGESPWLTEKLGEMTAEEKQGREKVRQQVIHGITNSLFNIALRVTEDNSELQGEIKTKLTAFGSKEYNPGKIVEAVGCLASLGPEADNIRVLLAPHLSTHPDREVRFATFQKIIALLPYENGQKLLEIMEKWDPDEGIKMVAARARKARMYSGKGGGVSEG